MSVFLWYTMNFPLNCYEMLWMLVLLLEGCRYASVYDPSVDSF